MENEIRDIQDALERERNKSLADEAAIKKLEDLLKKKVIDLETKQEEFEKAALKIQATEEELNFLKNEV